MGDALLQSKDDALQHSSTGDISKGGPPAADARKQHLQEPQLRRVGVRGGIVLAALAGPDNRRTQDVHPVPRSGHEQGGQTENGHVSRWLHASWAKAPRHTAEDEVDEKLPVPDVVLLRSAHFLDGDWTQGSPERPQVRLLPMAGSPECACQDLDEEDMVLDLVLGLGLELRKQCPHLLHEARITALRPEVHVGLKEGSMLGPSMARRTLHPAQRRHSEGASRGVHNALDGVRLCPASVRPHVPLVQAGHSPGCVLQEGWVVLRNELLEANVQCAARPALG
mmetsp:Transcript_126210/g.269231  ORF Transcript_126210/g.269231 Transcript_126210/m.269231 type:complete len:281 (-) Transcript_126210:122-964(-)